MSCVSSLNLSVVVFCWVGLCCLVLSLCPYLLSCFRHACLFLGFVVCPNQDLSFRHPFILSQPLHPLHFFHFILLLLVHVFQILYVFVSLLQLSCEVVPLVPQLIHLQHIRHLPSFHLFLHSPYRPGCLCHVLPHIY